MTNKYEPRFTRTVLALSIAAIGAAAPQLAWSEDGDEVARLIRPDSEIEVGVGFVSQDSYKFGDYTGLQREGVHVIGDVSVVRRGEGANYTEVQGRNLGLESRSVGVQVGEQGNYSVRVEYDQIPKLWSDSYQTPFTNPGNTNLRLPSNWTTTGNTTAGMPALVGSMQSFKIDTRRDSLSFGLVKQLATGWDAELRGKREKKEGNRLIGAVIGNSGGNPRAAILPEPVDYTTDEFEALVRYTSKKLQLQFGYFGSLFNNHNNQLTWMNPFGNSPAINGWASTVGFGLANNLGSLGLPPDNQFHQVSASGGYNFTKDTRLSSSLSLGRMTQDDPFLPYSVNAGLSAPTALPRTSLDGKVDTAHADLKLTSALMPKLYFTGIYRYDERDNKTPQATYVYIGGDSTTQVAPTAASDRIRTNLPGSSRKHQIDAEVDYHYTANTKLKFGYGYEWAKKTFEAITDEKEHTVKAEVHQHFNDMVSGGLGYAYSDRDTEWNGQGYNGSAPFIASFSETYRATVRATGEWDNLPAQKKFFMAPRQRDKVRAFLNVSPTDTVDLEFSADYKDDSYKESQYGLQKAKGWAFNFDGSLVATDALTTHVFASVDNYGTLQRSLQFQNTGFAHAKLTPTDGRFDYTYDIDDRTYTAGAGFRYKPLRKYEVGADVTYARSIGQISVTTGSGIVGSSARPMPDLETRLSRLDLFGQYQLQKDVTLKLKYIYERYTSKDWAYDGVTANTTANVIGTNQTSPDYNVHFVGVSVAYQF